MDQISDGLPDRAAAHAHVVQFYEDEHSIHDSVAEMDTTESDLRQAVQAIKHHAQTLDRLLNRMPSGSTVPTGSDR